VRSRRLQGTLERALIVSSSRRTNLGRQDAPISDEVAFFPMCILNQWVRAPRILDPSCLHRSGIPQLDETITQVITPY
jgi:hypothetical protein